MAAALWLLAALGIAAGGGAAWLFAATRGTRGVPATVSGDPALPRMEVGGVTLHATLHGPPGAPVIVVLHGGPGGDHRSLLPLAALADGHRMLFYDQRGAGLSERVPDAALTLEAHVEELGALLDRVSPDRPATLIGHSWGAMLATAFLGRRPGRVAAAVLIEPGFLGAAGARAWQARARRIMRRPAFLWRGLVAGFAAMHVRGPDPSAREDDLTGRMMAHFASDPATGYACPGEDYDSPLWRAGARAGPSVMAKAGTAALDALGGRAHRFAGPVLLMAGACSHWIGPDHQRGHLHLFRDAELAVIEGAGHDVVDDAPEAALTRIRAFLSGPAARPAGA